MKLGPNAAINIMKSEGSHQPQVLYHCGTPCGLWCSAPYISGNGNSKRWLGKPERPVEEPPMFDYEAFADEKTPSNVRMQRLFPKDIEVRTKFRDGHTEATLPHMFRGWNHDMCIYFKEEGDVERQRFHEGLRKVVHLDLLDANAEWEALDPSSSLGYNLVGHWEYRFLGQDGGPKDIERLLEAYVDIFGDMLEEDATKVISKYGHLAPADYFSTLPQRRLN